MSNSAENLTGNSIMDFNDVLTVGDLFEALKNLDKSMWACVTIEGHAYPLTICNAGILETRDTKNQFGVAEERHLFFIDVKNSSFLEFLDKEIVNPHKKRVLQ